MENFRTEVCVEWDEHEHVSPVEINWEFELEMRTWGIKSMIVAVPDQKVWLHWTEEKDGEDIDREEEIEIKDCKVSMKFNGDCLCPAMLTIEKEKFFLDD